MKLKAIYLMILSFFGSQKKKPEQVRLQKIEEPKKFKFNLNWKFLLGFTILVAIFCIIIYYIWMVGSLESTGYYYRLK